MKQGLDQGNRGSGLRFGSPFIGVWGLLWYFPETGDPNVDSQIVHFPGIPKMEPLIGDTPFKAHKP